MRSTITLEGILFGLGLSALAFAFTPIARRGFKPASTALTRGTQEAARNAQKWASILREELEDIVLEAQFEKMRRTVDRELRA